MTYIAIPLPPKRVGSTRAFESDILNGLGQLQKSIPCQYFYDAAGSVLFEQITELPEYYPTRAEVAILHACAGVIAAKTKPGTGHEHRNALATTDRCGEPWRSSRRSRRC